MKERACCFIGHSESLLLGEKRLKRAVEEQIKSGCYTFWVGTHGDFDTLARMVCRFFKKRYPQITVKLLITDTNYLTKFQDEETKEYLKDFEPVMIDLEKVHYKRRIELSNKHMVDSCDTMICYVWEDANWSRSAKVVGYARRKGLKVINIIYEEELPCEYNTKAEQDELFESARAEAAGRRK